MQAAFGSLRFGNFFFEAPSRKICGCGWANSQIRPRDSALRRPGSYRSDGDLVLRPRADRRAGFSHRIAAGDCQRNWLPFLCRARTPLSPAAQRTASQPTARRPSFRARQRPRAKLLDLRAATSLAWLHRYRGGRAKARSFAPMFFCFTGVRPSSVETTQPEEQSTENKVRSLGHGR